MLKRVKRKKTKKETAVSLFFNVSLVIIACFMIFEFFSFLGDGEIEAPPVEPVTGDVDIAEDTHEEIDGTQPIAIDERKNEDYFYNFNYAVMEKVDFTADTVLTRIAEYYELNAIEIALTNLSLNEMRYGYYTNSGRQEAILIYEFHNTSHAEGFGRKMLLLLDVESGELLLQRSFASDRVDFYMLEDYDRNNYILSWGASWFQGFESQQLQLASLENGEWNVLPIPCEDEDLRLYYDYDEISSKLTVQEYEYDVVEEGIEEGVYFTVDIGEPRVYKWNKKTGLFEEVLEQAEEIY